VTSPEDGRSDGRVQQPKLIVDGDEHVVYSGLVRSEEAACQRAGNRLW